MHRSLEFRVTQPRELVGTVLGILAKVSDTGRHVAELEDACATAVRLAPVRIKVAGACGRHGAAAQRRWGKPPRSARRRSGRTTSRIGARSEWVTIRRSSTDTSPHSCSSATPSSTASRRSRGHRSGRGCPDSRSPHPVALRYPSRRSRCGGRWPRSRARLPVSAPSVGARPLVRPDAPCRSRRCPTGSNGLAVQGFVRLGAGLEVPVSYSVLMLVCRAAHGMMLPSWRCCTRAGN